MGWLKRFFTNRYIKSFTRYALVALVAYLVQIPALAPLAELIRENLDQYVELIAGVLSALVLAWSARKNSINAKVEKEIQVILPVQKPEVK